MNRKKVLTKLSRLQKGDIAGGTLYLIVIILAISALSLMLTNGLVPSRNPVNTGNPVTIVPPTPGTGNKNLQLYTFGYTTPAPTPTPTPPPAQKCAADSLKNSSCGACVEGQAGEVAACGNEPCTGTSIPTSFYGPPYDCVYMSTLNQSLYQQKLQDPNCTAACFGKPVIYLYPTNDTLVDVRLSIPGKIVESDPLYPTNGWTNVLAHPDGSLTYQAKTYHELYYESQVNSYSKPKNGIVIETKDLAAKLNDITAKLGLIKPEQVEFLNYWMPRLNNLNSPYILFSLINQQEKERVDHIDVTPAPQTRIEFLAYFKPLDKPTTVDSLSLPSTPQQRIGFTEVEWGGTIDYQNY